MNNLNSLIDAAYEQRSQFTPQNAPADIKHAVLEVINMLDLGKCRVAEKINGEWIVNQWVKKAVLLYFAMMDSCVIDAGFDQFYDKVPLKHSEFSLGQFKSQAARIVPHACVRKGAFIAPKVVVMPAFINIGAYVDSGTMIDTWATVGSCAQIGQNVHLSGGAGIGGVLEPVQAQPVIIEDNVFVGARSEIVEGVIVERNAVISMGVFIGASTRIYNRETGEISYGRIPAGAVVVPGNLPSSDGKYSLYCAVIVKQVDEKTRMKTSVNELLRL